MLKTFGLGRHMPHHMTPKVVTQTFGDSLAQSGAERTDRPPLA